MDQLAKNQCEDLALESDKGNDSSGFEELLDLFPDNEDEASSSIERLKTLIHSIERELTSDILEEICRELKALKEVWAEEKINLVYLQAIGKISQYMAAEARNAHPDSQMFLLSLYQNLEKIVSDESWTKDQKKELLREDIKKYSQFIRELEQEAVEHDTEAKEQSSEADHSMDEMEVSFSAKVEISGTDYNNDVDGESSSIVFKKEPLSISQETILLEGNGDIKADHIDEKALPLQNRESAPSLIGVSGEEDPEITEGMSHNFEEDRVWAENEKDQVSIDSVSSVCSDSPEIEGKGIKDSAAPHAHTLTADSSEEIDCCNINLHDVSIYNDDAQETADAHLDLLEKEDRDGHILEDFQKQSIPKKSDTAEANFFDENDEMEESFFVEPSLQEQRVKDDLADVLEGVEAGECEDLQNDEFVSAEIVAAVDGLAAREMSQSAKQDRIERSTDIEQSIEHFLNREEALVSASEIDEEDDYRDGNSVFTQGDEKHTEIQQEVALLAQYCNEFASSLDEKMLEKILLQNDHLIEMLEGRPLELHFLLLFTAVADYLEKNFKSIDDQSLSLLSSISRTLGEVFAKTEAVTAQKMLLRESGNVLGWLRKLTG